MSSQTPLCVLNPLIILVYITPLIFVLLHLVTITTIECVMCPPTLLHNANTSLTLSHSIHSMALLLLLLFLPECVLQEQQT